MPALILKDQIELENLAEGVAVLISLGDDKQKQRMPARYSGTTSETDFFMKQGANGASKVIECYYSSRASHKYDSRQGLILNAYVLKSIGPKRKEYFELKQQLKDSGLWSNQNG